MSANFTNVFWTAPKQFHTQTFLKPISGHLGFQINIPKPDPVTSGFYYGENPPINNVRAPTVVTRSDPEWYVVDGTMPTVAGHARMDPTSKAMKFSRAKYTRTIKV